jgi:hypothetical protein
MLLVSSGGVTCYCCCCRVVGASLKLVAFGRPRVISMYVPVVYCMTLRPYAVWSSGDDADGEMADV